MTQVVYPEPEPVCPTCKGKEWIPKLNLNTLQWSRIPCPDCKGPTV